MKHAIFCKVISSNVVVLGLGHLWLSRTAKLNCCSEHQNEKHREETLVVCVVVVQQQWTCNLRPYRQNPTDVQFEVDSQSIRFDFQNL